MTLCELKRIIDELVEIESHYPSARVLSIVVPVKSDVLLPSSRGRKYVDIKSINLGFDWDSGKIFLELEKDVYMFEAKLKTN